MPQTNAERQRAWRQRHRGEPRGNAAMMAQLAAMQGRVVQLEVELSTRPSASPRPPTGRLLQAYVAVRRERDDLAESLAQLEAYQPDILNMAKAWLASIERTARGADDDSERPERN